MSDSAAVIAHNTDLERRAVAAEAIDPQNICITVGRDGRAHYGRNPTAAWLRARKWTFLSRTIRDFVGG